MKIKLGQIVNSVPAMNKLVAKDLPLAITYKLSIMIDELNPQLKFFEQKCKSMKERIEKEGDSAINELMDFEVDVNIETIKIPIDEDIRLSVSDINLLKPFVKFQ